MATAALAALALALPSAARPAPGCRATLVTSVAFGTYELTSRTPRRTTGRVRLDCPAGRSVQITLSRGNSTTYGWREMRSGTEVLRYNLYLDPGLTVVWGDGTDGSAPLVSPGGSGLLTFYASIPPGQDVAAGDYGDVLTLTVVL